MSQDPLISKLTLYPLSPRLDDNFATAKWLKVDKCLEQVEHSS
jgi:hypothetical protein